MLKHLMIAVDWFGPYSSVKEARDAARPYDWPGLYMLIGKVGEEEASRAQYVGISASLSGRLTARHHKLGSEAIEARGIRELRLWLGEVTTAEPGGKKMKITRATLNYSEWLHARFMKLPLNDLRTKTLPDRSVTVLNRWWKTDFATLQARRPHPDWPNLIDFPHYGLPARTVWFGGKQRTFSNADNYAHPE
ncbi:hypothetical protein FHS25_005169 [Rhizobium laguerreae]|uniref:GIY-YIG nuclease family protein n=1 Tax=Rhizobium laguerreae TaxID=1076926 RepID=A0ABR6GEK8_9HYPH|nr:hypothetical protein [Rhizobium laguerreae]MBB3164666.1 hypothetical protein [Rhizobium laguerreae]OOO46419.1 hypothetical protein BS630_25540 [Rhizobium laguerreae]